MNKTSIEWTDYTWNPVTGCSKISQGCKHCYAETLTNRFGKVWNQPSFRTITCHNDRLSEPFMMFGKLRGKKVFVCDMSDLFHEQVSFIFLLSVYQQFSLCPDTTFQVLTKRPERALEFYLWANDSIAHIKNVWIGVSVEDQKASDERIPLLLQIPATVRFLSCEPLIGAIDLKLRRIDDDSHYVCSQCGPDKNGSNIHTKTHHTFEYMGDLKGAIKSENQIHWVICGGESGNRKTVRPMHPDWARSLRDQCKAAGVPFFFKQWGNYIPYQQIASDLWQSSQTQCTFNAFVMNEMTPKAKQIVDDGILYRKRNNSMCKNYLDGAQHLEFPINN